MEILTADILIKLTSGTELVQTKLVQTELVGMELVIKLITELEARVKVQQLEARVKVQQLEALKVLLIAIHYQDSLKSQTSL